MANFNILAGYQGVIYSLSIANTAIAQSNASRHCCPICKKPLKDTDRQNHAGQHILRAMRGVIDPGVQVPVGVPKRLEFSLIYLCSIYVGFCRVSVWYVWRPDSGWGLSDSHQGRQGRFGLPICICLPDPSRFNVPGHAPMYKCTNTLPTSLQRNPLEIQLLTALLGAAPILEAANTPRLPSPHPHHSSGAVVAWYSSSEGSRLAGVGHDTDCSISAGFRPIMWSEKAS